MNAPEQLALFGSADPVMLEPEERRSEGVTLTPPWLVETMLDRLAEHGPFDTIVDCGAGTGRFAIAAARRFKQARVVAVERHAVLLERLREGLRESGVGARVAIEPTDFFAWRRPPGGRVAFIGNPPYVRHHDLAPSRKQAYRDTMRSLGGQASQLAGLHLHFMAHIAAQARAGDALLFVTAAEWLDNGYGAAMRDLVAGAEPTLAVSGLWLAPPGHPVFPDALVSAVVVEALVGKADAPVNLGSLSDGRLRTHRCWSRSQLRALSRWGPACEPQLVADEGGVALGSRFRVTRGQVTGANAAWVFRAGELDLPARLLRPVLSRAQELISGTVEADDALDRVKRVVELPEDLSQLEPAERPLVDRFLDRARHLGADRSYIARQRRHWHVLDLRSPPPVLVSYMGRRPPVFRRNPHALTFLNIAHGLYPREPMAEGALDALVAYLNRSVTLGSGRVYGGGMAKFEPSDIARIPVPPELLGAAG